VRKPVAVILLFAFVAAQYARQVSYLECKLVNYFSQSAVKCDCEKLLGFTTDSPASSLPIIHNHIHLDEWYSLAHGYALLHPVQKQNHQWPVIPGPMLAAGRIGSPDHPPQLL
jgi:hypothetical protein